MKLTDAIHTKCEYEIEFDGPIMHGEYGNVRMILYRTLTITGEPKEVRLRVGDRIEYFNAHGMLLAVETG